MQLVIQLAKAKGIHTINVVRDRPNMDELEHYLTGLGADVVTTDDKLKAALGQHHVFLSWVSFKLMPCKKPLCTGLAGVAAARVVHSICLHIAA